MSGTNSILEIPSDVHSRRSAKTKDSQAVTEVVDNRAPEQDDPILAEEPREAAQLIQSNSSMDDHVSLQVQELNQQQQEQQGQEHRVRTPFEVVPGLEGDDILPGLSAKVDDARSTLKNVLSFMSGSREDALSTSSSTDLSQSAGAGLVPAAVKAEPTQQAGGMGGMRNVSNPIDAPSIESRPPRQPLSFWQRFTCYTAD